MPRIVPLLASDRELTSHATIWGPKDLRAGDALSIWLPSSERYQSGQVLERQRERAIIVTDGKRFTLYLHPNRVDWSISDSGH